MCVLGPCACVMAAVVEDEDDRDGGVWEDSSERRGNGGFDQESEREMCRVCLSVVCVCISAWVLCRVCAWCMGYVCACVCRAW